MKSKKLFEIKSPAFKETKTFTTYRAARHEAAYRTVMTGKVWGVREISTKEKEEQK